MFSADDLIFFCKLGTKETHGDEAHWGMRPQASQARVVAHDVIEHTLRQRGYYRTPVEEELMAIGGVTVCRPEIHPSSDIAGTVRYRLPKPCLNYRFKGHIEEHTTLDYLITEDIDCDEKDLNNINDWIALGAAIKLRQFGGISYKAQDAFTWLKDCMEYPLNCMGNSEEIIRMNFVFDTETCEFNYREKYYV